MLTVYSLTNGRVDVTHDVDLAWLDPDNAVTFWADFVGPAADEVQLLARTFGFHELAIEDAVSETHQPKVESYPGFLYVILHGIDYELSEHQFATHDIDFFLGTTYLVTVHGGLSRSVKRVAEVCEKTSHVLQEGPAALMHRIIDAMVDHYRPERPYPR